MTPIELLLSHLPKARRADKGWSAKCPAHEDRNASLSFREGNDGAAVLKCHAGCEASAVMAALGLKLADLFPAKDTPHRNGKTKFEGDGLRFQTPDLATAEAERRLGRSCSKNWIYRDAEGKAVGAVLRWDGPDGKSIRPIALYADGWGIGAMPEPRPLYRLPEILQEIEVVVVTEGEKAADAACSLGFCATTSSGGSQASGKTDWLPLAAKEAWILADNDAAGRKYAEDVATTLSRLRPETAIRIVELPGLGEGDDIVEWIEAHGEAAEPSAMKSELETLAQASEPWRSPDADEDTSFRPFPTDALPQPLRNFVETASKAIGCDPSYVALPLLVGCAAAIGNSRRLLLKRGWAVPAMLWAAIVGESGTAKSPAFKLVMRPFRKREERSLERHAEAMKQYRSDLAHWEKESNAWKRAKGPTGEPPMKPEVPPCERGIVADTTVEALAPILLVNPRGLLLARDELAGWIGSFDRYSGKGSAGSDASNWLSMHNAEAIIVDRRTGVPPVIYVPAAAVSIIGGIQPGILARALGKEHRESGLAARLLLAFPPRRVKQWTEADIDPAIEDAFAAVVDRLYNLEPTSDEEGKPRPALVRLAHDAKAAFKAYYNEHAEEQADLTGDLSAAWSKLEEYAARLALVIHCVCWAAKDPTLLDPNTVDAQSMEAGIRLTQWFKHEARRIYRILDESEGDQDQRRLTDWIERKGGTVTARHVQQGCRWLKAPGKAEAALEALVKAGVGFWQPTPSGQRGQPTRWFRLKRASTVYGNGDSSESENSVDVDGVDGRKSRPHDGSLFGDQEGLPD